MVVFCSPIKFNQIRRFIFNYSYTTFDYNSSSDEHGYSAIGACVGESSDRIQEIKERFPNEFIAVIPWDENINKFIVSALTPLKERHINNIELDEENLIANVYVKNEQACLKALGRGNNNIKLACELTGWVININKIKQAETVETPEEELSESICNAVPEIKSNKIEIMGIARIEDKVSRVLVKWVNPEERSMASIVCYGNNNDNIKKIMNGMDNGKIFFHEWTDDTEDLIIRCLYPLNREDVASLTFNTEDKNAEIRLVEEEESYSKWKDEKYIATAEKVAGYKIEITNNS